MMSSQSDMYFLRMGIQNLNKFPLQFAVDKCIVYCTPLCRYLYFCFSPVDYLCILFHLRIQTCNSFCVLCTFVQAAFNNFRIFCQRVFLSHISFPSIFENKNHLFCWSVPPCLPRPTCSHTHVMHYMLTHLTSLLPRSCQLEVGARRAQILQSFLNVFCFSSLRRRDKRC